ncbi:bifunctional adenosylcobinamide kinase/adenosylcobinamide-phosphate guanylyltransferase [Faecalicatena contorta]|uniref:Adenosylcobinamide kinase n=1 Tax=Faecalicatena contorta TaxID=39482 RepID=A0A316A5E1_9FIRM|nr:bifunctional adenosylcobinamide kinase/adenosylcobinamide-phosphate guanylyltransferase [Faecalicatena contorta]PWJ52170.1 adenosylcobinamide kinase /adenosylcobinamide-phosphate guanylyltransferase [Faecalicatena contorta]SUQ12448.1 adenosylcobinamide kinase /adenosylcobinamide-phosphate guanylyltransferase [Faecalicatena contorta]
MFHVVTGGSGSGKSAFAEEIICKYHRESIADGSAGNLIYVATMIPYGEETMQKIHRHQMMREKKGFFTMECYTGLERLSKSVFFQKDPEKPCILLECMSNLTANEIYEPDGAGIHAAEKILQGIKDLKQMSCHLVIVTNEVCSDSAEDSKEMKFYKQVLSKVNRDMAEMADRVTEVVYGIPVTVKGKSFRNMKEGAAGKEMGQKETLRMVVGGAYQGKRKFAEKLYGNLHWVNGESCPLEEVYTCEGIYHFEKYIRRMLKEGREFKGLADSIARNNPGLVILVDEIGCGLVPADAFERKFREQAGRICTELAERSLRVDRVVCGVGIPLKNEEKRI